MKTTQTVSMHVHNAEVSFSKTVLSSGILCSKQHNCLEKLCFIVK